jgi:hypothetical protein
MKNDVSNAIAELQRQFSDSPVSVVDDGQGGAYIFIEAVQLSPRFNPRASWVGFHIPAQYPYADVYPVFIAGNVTRADGIAFVAPVTSGHNFQGRPAIQISRRASTAPGGTHNVTAKILKVIYFLEHLP